MFATLVWKVKNADSPARATAVNNAMSALLAGRGVQLKRKGEWILRVRDLGDFNTLALALKQLAARYRNNFEFLAFLHGDGAVVHGGPNDPHADPALSPIIR